MILQGVIDGVELSTNLFIKIAYSLVDVWLNSCNLNDMLSFFF